MSKRFLFPRVNQQYIIRRDLYIKITDIRIYPLQLGDNPPPVIIFPMNTIFTVTDVYTGAVRIKVDESPNSQIRIHNKWRVNIPFGVMEQMDVSGYAKPQP